MWTYPKDSRQAAAAVSFGLLTYFMSEFFTSPEAPIVTVSTGRVKGFVSKSRNGWEYFEYLGIPYAKPPLGDLRFEVRYFCVLVITRVMFMRFCVLHCFKSVSVLMFLWILMMSLPYSFPHSLLIILTIGRGSGMRTSMHLNVSSLN